jgi:hypothetical protein
MATIVLIPGADGRGWYWHRVVSLLRDLDHLALPVGLPLADPTASLAALARVVVAAISSAPCVPGGALLIVGQSLAGFIAPLVCEQIRTDLLVLLNPMVPRPDESAGQWWSATAHAEARAAYGEFDLMRDFFHDVPPEVTAAAFASPPPDGPSERLFADLWPLDRWPKVPTRIVQGVDDRFFPLDFQRLPATSSDALFASGSDSSLTSCPAATCSHSAIPKSWRGDSMPIRPCCRGPLLRAGREATTVSASAKPTCRWFSNGRYRRVPAARFASHARVPSCLRCSWPHGGSTLQTRQSSAHSNCRMVAAGSSRK